jgi:hypothetical protein
MERVMGCFCVNLHVRTDDDQAVSAALERRGVERYRVLRARGGWVSVYEERASQQDEGWIRELAEALSDELHVAAIAMLVHDSDIACYWLCDDGRLLDEYNSCPNYFDGDSDDDGPSGGQSDVLLRYCRTVVSEDDLVAILTERSVFAEALVERLADALGIDRARALGDYRSEGGAESDEEDGDDDDDDDKDRSAFGGASLGKPRTGLVGRLAGMLGAGRTDETVDVDPGALKLVRAAAEGDIPEIERLLESGVAIDAEAPTGLPGSPAMAGLVNLMPGGAPQFAMSPLVAAIVNKQPAAVRRLLDAGADPNRVHPLFGTPVHAATGAGDPGLLQAILDHGGNVSAPNAQGLTPLQTLAAHRATRDRLAQAETLCQSMGWKLPPVFGHLANVALPTEGWDACEKLLKNHGAGSGE